MKPKERIPLHDHADNDSGGPIDRETVLRAGSGPGSVGSTTGGGVTPTGGGPGTPAESSMVPYYIETSFTVPEFRQALFSETIGGPGLLVVEGILIEVD